MVKLKFCFCIPSSTIYPSRIGGSTERVSKIIFKEEITKLNIALEQGYAAKLHEQMLFSTAVVLFIFIMIINLVLARIQKKGGDC